MLNNDISNRMLPIIAFNFESVFMKPIPFTDRLLFSKYSQIKRSFIKDNTRILKQIWDKGNAQIHIVSFLDDTYCQAIEKFLIEDLQLYNIFYKLDEESLEFKCEYHYLYYIDNERDRYTNSRTLKGFMGVIC